MPRLPLAFLSALLASVLTACNKPAEQHHAWSVAVATRSTDGHRLIERYRSDFPPNVERARFPDRVTIVWTYQSGDGQPSSTEFKSMSELEDLLAPRVEQPALGQLVLVTTGDGRREWVYYTRSQKEFMVALNAALDGHARFPIEIDLAKDPRWEGYDAFRHSLAEQLAAPTPATGTSRTLRPR